MPLIVTKWWYFIIIVQFLRFLTVAQAVWFGCGFAFCILTSLGLNDRPTDQPTDWLTDGLTVCHLLFQHCSSFLDSGQTHWTVEMKTYRIYQWIILFMTQIKSSLVAIWVTTWFTSDILSFTYCVREALSTLTLPFRKGNLRWVFRLWCAPTVVCMSVYTKVKNVHSQCFHTEKSAQLEILLFISKCQYC